MRLEKTSFLASESGKKSQPIVPLYWKVSPTRSEKEANMALDFRIVQSMTTVKTDGKTKAQEEKHAHAARVESIKVPVLTNHKEIGKGDFLKFLAVEAPKKAATKSIDEAKLLRDAIGSGTAKASAKAPRPLSPPAAKRRRRSSGL